MFVPPTVQLLPVSPSPSPSSISDSTRSGDVDRVPLMIYTFITLHLLGSFIFTIVLILTSFSPSRLYCHFLRRRRRRDSSSFSTSATRSTLLNSTHLNSSSSTSNNSRPKATPGTTSTSTWRSFCIAYIVFGLSYTIGTLISLGYGHGIEGMDRIAEDEGLPRAVCVIQTGLIYAAPALGGNATLALIVQLRSVMLFEMGKIKKPMSVFTRKLIVVVPWVLWLINIAVILIFTLRNPSLLEMNEAGMYCHLKEPIISRIIAAWFTILLFVAIGIEGYLVMLMYKQGFRLAGKCDASRTAIRLGIFTLQSITMVGLGLLSIFVETGGLAAEIMIAVQTPFAAILFGLRSRLLCCSRRRKEEELIKDMAATTVSTISESPTTESSNNHRRRRGSY